MFQISKYALLSQMIYVLVNFHRLLILFSKTQFTSLGLGPESGSTVDP